jgi:hypothetical protein
MSKISLDSSARLCASACFRFSFLWVVGALVVTGVCGCGSRGQSSGRPDLDAIPELQRRAEGDKATLYEFRAKVRKRGVAAAKQEVPDLVATFEAYQKLKLGEHQETYKQILEKLKELQGMLAGSPTKEAVTKAADEVGALAAKLPGTVNENPQVE